VERICEGGDLFSEELPCPKGYVCDNGMCIVTPCIDTDDGLNRGEKGTATSGDDSGTDFCEDGKLKEYYCEAGTVAFKEMDCPLKQHCVDGACVDYACMDSDGGKVKSKKGTTSYITDSAEDECADDTTVTEYYCEGNDIESEEMECDRGDVCDDGECVEGPACVDSDNGKDKFTKGEVTVGDDEYEDSCYSDSQVLEYFCVGDNADMEKLQCGSDYECKFGKCVVLECSKDEDSFSETDVRFRISQFGSSKKLRLYADDAVEIEDEMFLELTSVSGTQATFKLYNDFADYEDNDDICSDSADENDTITDMCGESIGDLEIDAVDDGDDYADIFLDEFAVTEYYTGDGDDVQWFGPACTEDDEKIYDRLDMYFYPYIDTDSSGLNLDGRDFKIFGLNAEIVDIDTGDNIFSIEIDGDDYDLEDGEDFEYNGRDYEVDLYFNDGGLYRVLVERQ
jgi:hypothetical protein